MCAVLIGGMDMLERNYITEAEKLRIDLKVFTKPEIEMESNIRNADALVIFTNKVSNKTKKEAMNVARAKNITVFMHYSCGICTLWNCLNCLKKTKGGVKSV